MRGVRASLAPFGLCLLAGAAVLFVGQPAHGQVINGNQWPVPRLTVLTPNGGKVGATFDATFAGTELNDPKALWFSHPGIKAEPIIPPPPKVDPKEKKDDKKPPPPPPPITQFKITIAKDVPVGAYDVRFVNKWGISNPRVFVIGDLNEVAEKEDNNDVEKAQKVDPGTTVTGNISAAVDVDYFQFVGKKDQRVLVSCLCASIDSRLHPELKLLDPAGRQLAYHRPLPGQDGVVAATLPADGEYLVRLNQFTYTQGSNEFFYRLNISTGPWIDVIYPPMIEPGKAADVTLYGRNLPGGKADPAAVVEGQVLDKLTVKITPPNDPTSLQFRSLVSPTAAFLDGFDYRLGSPAGMSNPVLLTYAKAPVVVENDANDVTDKAQAIPVPCELAGRIDKKGDRDWFSFDAKKGDVFLIEAFSHRLGAPPDLFLSLRQTVITKTPSKEKDKKEIETKTLQEIVLLDDNTDTINLKNLFTGTRDPAPYQFTVPADGKYHLLVASHLAELLADPTHVYRIRISKPTPDFRLIVTPADEFRPDSCFLGQSGVQHYNVYAQRLEGFAGDIDLTMEGLPAGVTCPPQLLTKGQRQTHLAVIAADNAAPFVGSVKVKGTAVINGQKVVREARPASVSWAVPPNQNIPALSRLDQTLAMAVIAKAPGKLQAAVDKININVGEKANVNYKLLRYSGEFAKVNFQVQPVPGDLPGGMAFNNLTFAPGKDDQQAVFTVGTNTPPGTYNVILRGFAPIAFEPKGKGVNTVIPATPVLVSVMPKQVATLSVDNANPSIKAGAEAVILVRVARQFDYAGEFKVQFELPKGVTGVTGADIVIPAGQNEAKLTLKVPANTPVGPRQNINLKATAVVSGVAGNVTLNHETKINVTVVK